MRIVNGEIIRDNSDGVNKRRSNNRGNIASLSSNSEIPSTSTGRRMNENDPNNSTPSSHNNNRTWNDYAQAMNNNRASRQENIIEKIEIALGIKNSYLTIPAYPDINLTESKIPMIYIVMTGIGYLLFESKALLIGIAAFIYMKYSENR